MQQGKHTQHLHEKIISVNINKCVQNTRKQQTVRNGFGFNANNMRRK